MYFSAINDLKTQQLSVFPCRISAERIALHSRRSRNHFDAERERERETVRTPVNLNNTRAKRMRKLVNRYPLCSIPFLPENSFPSPHSALVERLSGSVVHGHRERREYHRRRARERETRYIFSTRAGKRPKPHT